jgi:DNA recombination protein RmuC
METISLLIGLALGGGVTFIIVNLLVKTNSVSKVEYESLNTKYNEVLLNEKVLENKLQNLQEIYESLYINYNTNLEQLNSIQHKATTLEEKQKNSDLKIEELTQSLLSEIELKQKQQDDLIDQKQTISDLKSKNETLTEKLTTQKSEFDELQKTAHLQFEKIANQLFEEKSEKFNETNKVSIESLLNPLKEDILRFKEKVETTHTEDTKQRSSLEEKIKGLVEQTTKVSEEANNLASALKGKAQKRGNWGEMILERILESSGLTKDREYFVQDSIKDIEGKNQRLDVKVNLPDDRIIIIDSKVSLIAYDNYCASEDSEEQKRLLSEHIKATKLHIDQLSNKKYDDMDTSLDFTMMFVPIEPAYLLAVQGDSDLWSYAYAKRILLVSPTTLIACLKLFSDLWRREWQNKNAMDIVKRGESLYEKFVGFTDSFENIGNQINATKATYEKALGQLSTGKGSAISQAIQLKELGLKSEKKISEKLLPPNFHEGIGDVD